MNDRSITSRFYINNRQQLLKSLSADVVMLAANGVLQKSLDQAYPFRQDSNFWYLTGLNEPDLILVMTNKEQFLIVPEIYVRRQAILKPFEPRIFKAVSGIGEVLNEKEGWQKTRSLLPKKPAIATLKPSSSLLKNLGIYPNPARGQLRAKIKRQFSNVQLVDVSKALARQRMIKQPLEIELLKKAINITAETMSDVLASSKLNGYKDTAQIVQALLAGFKSQGAQGHAFDPIVAVGKDATFIHYQELGQPLVNNQLLVCDVGGEYSHYAADLTRTISIGRPTARQVAVYEAVREVQAQAYKLIKAGLKVADYEYHVERLIGQQLINLGLIKEPSHSAIRQYYPHACSHSLGLDAHDAADYSMKLPANMVMTVEPGIYIIEEGIGVRLEDVVLVTKDGCQILSSSLPTSLKL